MSIPDHATIDACLRRIVRQEFAVDKDSITVKKVRRQAEQELGLPHQFFKHSERWRTESEIIIRIIFENLEREAPPGDGAVRDEPEKDVSPRKAEENSQRSKQTSNGKRKPAERAEQGEQPTPKKPKTAAVGRYCKAESSSDSINVQDVSSSHSNPCESTSLGGATQTAPRQRFDPPAEYTAAEPNLLVANSTFTRANLKGKQIFIISAPADVPVSSIREIDFKALQSGSPFLTHNGCEYRLNPESSVHAEQSTLMLPNGSGFERAEHQIHRAFRLQRHIPLPSLVMRKNDEKSGSLAAADVGRALVSTARPQPKGLRMRYKPPGFGPGDPGHDDEESGSEKRGRHDSSSVQFPRTVGAHGAKEQDDGRTAVDVDGEVNEAKTKREKERARGEEHARSKRRRHVGVEVSAQAGGTNGVSREEGRREERERKDEKRARRGG